MNIPDKALSVRQPWAWSIIHGGKDIENRSAAAVRHGMSTGRIAIHASKGMTRDEYEDTRDFMEKIGVDCPRPDALIRGGIIGLVSVVDIVKESDSPWFFGPRGLVLTDPVSIEPYPFRGALGYFDLRDGYEHGSSGDEFDLPKPWMHAWPDGPKPRSSRRAIPEPASNPMRF